MGKFMSNHLASKFHVIGYDISESARALATIPTVKTVDDLHGSDCMITMLPNGQLVEDFYRKAWRVLRPAGLLIDCSTTGPQASLRLLNLAREHEHEFVDAPVSGGVQGAQCATLSFMVGCAAGKAPEDILLSMGKRIFCCGEVGMGQVAKLCNNLVLAISMVGLSEALTLAKRHGMDLSLMNTIINASTGRSWASEVNSPIPGFVKDAPAGRDYTGGFTNQLISKDVNLAMHNELSDDLTVSIAVEQIYTKLAQDPIYAKLDFSSIFRSMK